MAHKELPIATRILIAETVREQLGVFAHLLISAPSNGNSGLTLAEAISMAIIRVLESSE